MESPEISIIICTYNRGHQLYPVMESIAAQVEKLRNVSCELIIVDNNSVDKTKDMVQQFSTEKTHFVKYVFEPRQGKAFALNKGITEAKSEQLLFTDDDVVLDPNWIQTVREAFEKYPFDAFGGKVVPVIEGRLPDWVDKTGTILYGPLVKHDEGENIREYDSTMRAPIGCNMFVRKELFRKYGCYDIRLGHYTSNEHIGGEEIELLNRFRRSGVRSLYYPRAVVYHPIQAERLSRSYFKKSYWGNGRGFARWDEPPENCVRYFNIPRYTARMALREVSKAMWMALRRDRARTFFHELKLLFYLGMAYEYYLNGE
jgi:glucosyl-dolichyl phosphate glucuronosyltransferase